MIELAQHYARSGYPVFPLVPGRKEPLTNNGFKAATTSSAEIDQFWARWPEANIGIATGVRSGLLVIDVDVKRDGWRESLQSLSLPQTFTVRTWSGGWHLYFKMPAARITIGTGLLSGLDWRGEGGYVVAAGSIVNAAHYSIVRNVPVVHAPQTLVELILATRKKRVIEHDDAGQMVIREPGRNQRLCAIAGALRRFGVGRDAILDAIVSISEKHCDPPLEEHELQQIACSVSRYAPKSTRGAA